MLIRNENNWYSWQYAEDPAYGRQPSNLEFKTSYKKYTKEIKSFDKELANAAKSTIDLHLGLHPTIMFSGGLDSELLIRTYLSIGITPKILIVRYENDYNLYDVSYAVTICSMLNIDYTIIDFNLTKFYENDAERIAEISQIDRARALPYCKFLEIADGLPIMGEGDPYWVRLDDNYLLPNQWRYRELETFKGWHKYAMHLNKPAIVQFFKWTPGLVLSHSKLKWLQLLINDAYYGKLGTNSTKLIGYREVYPELLERKKQTGFEKIDHLVTEFEVFINEKNKGFIYRQYVDRTFDELWLDITGHTSD
jgi:hypothetical protein